MFSFTISNVFLVLVITALDLAIGAPVKSLDATTLLKNGQAAQKLNLAYQTMNVTAACIDDDKACISGGVASCQNAKWVVGQGKCSKSQACFALPSTQETGTLVTCTSEKSALSAIEATGAPGGIFGSSNTTDSRTPTSKDSSESDDEDDTEKNATTTTAVPSSTSRSPSPKSTISPEPTTSLSKSAERELFTVTETITKTQTIARATSAPSSPTSTSPQIVTLTVTLGDIPTTLAPVTRTLSPAKASKLLSRLMANGATVIDDPSSPSATASIVSSMASSK